MRRFYCSRDLLHEAPHQSKAVPLARGRLHKADAVVAECETGARGVWFQSYVDRNAALGPEREPSLCNF